MKNQKIRSMKVHEQSGYNYKATPTIILKGQWLKEMGFEIGDYITVSCEDGKLIITPDAEKAAMAKEEAEFMDKEMKKLLNDVIGMLLTEGIRSIFEEKKPKFLLTRQQ